MLLANIRLSESCYVPYKCMALVLIGIISMNNDLKDILNPVYTL